MLIIRYLRFIFQFIRFTFAIPSYGDSVTLGRQGCGENQGARTEAGEAAEVQSSLNNGAAQQEADQQKPEGTIKCLMAPGRDLSLSDRLEIARKVERRDGRRTSSQGDEANSWRDLSEYGEIQLSDAK